MRKFSVYFLAAIAVVVAAFSVATPSAHSRPKGPIHVSGVLVGPNVCYCGVTAGNCTCLIPVNQG
jgi:hypothetical protein